MDSIDTASAQRRYAEGRVRCFWSLVSLSERSFSLLCTCVCVCVCLFVYAAQLLIRFRFYGGTKSGKEAQEEIFFVAAEIFLLEFFFFSFFLCLDFLRPED